mmetsp:Transcript_23947/g.43826  ORF Transcript_23947/g.43826 Transcript_23947/m.43826 type:complete len:128 (-) Transcript_23947:28-411(-)
MYVLLTGGFPFESRNQQKLFHKILTATPDFEFEEWHSISTETQDVVKALLSKKSKSRPTVRQAWRQSLGAAGPLSNNTQQVKESSSNIWGFFEGIFPYQASIRPTKSDQRKMTAELTASLSTYSQRR